jgi:hypothetical protein
VEEENIRGETVFVESWGKAQPARDIFEILSVTGSGTNKDRLVNDSFARRHANRGVDTRKSPRLEVSVNGVEEGQGSGTGTSTHHPRSARHTFQNAFEVG